MLVQCDLSSPSKVSPTVYNILKSTVCLSLDYISGHMYENILIEKFLTMGITIARMPRV